MRTGNVTRCGGTFTHTHCKTTTTTTTTDNQRKVGKYKEAKQGKTFWKEDGQRNVLSSRQFSSIQDKINVCLGTKLSLILSHTIYRSPDSGDKKNAKKYRLSASPAPESHLTDTFFATLQFRW